MRIPNMKKLKYTLLGAAVGVALLAGAELTAQTIGGGLYSYFNPATPGAIGGTTPAAGSFTTLGGTVVSASTAFRAPDGTGTVPSVSFTNANTEGFRVAGANDIRWTGNSTDMVRIVSTGAGFGFGIRSNTALQWGAGTTNDIDPDLKLFRDAANTLAQRNGTNAQVFNIYSTFTNASNYERLTFSAPIGASPVIATDALGTGIARDLVFASNGASRIAVSSAALRPTGALTNAYDLGILGTSIFRTGYFGTSVSTPKITYTGFLFANIATSLTANGEVGYCSDCTIAAVCIGAGTGAIAKRLNGVNVCN